MAQGQRAGLITPRSLDRNELPVSNPSSHRCIKALEQPLNRYGAAAARRAHNPEVTGSKPVVGIQPITSHRCIKALEQPLNRHGAEEARGAHNSEVTRSKRVAGIITIQLLCRSSTRLHMDTLTGMAQRKREGLITPRSLDRNGLPVFLYVSPFSSVGLEHQPSKLGVASSSLARGAGSP